MAFVLEGFWDAATAGKKEFTEALMNSALLQSGLAADKPTGGDLQGAGMVYYETDTKRLVKYNGSIWELLDPGVRFARKASDETVNNSATLQDDDDLSFAVADDEIWWISMRLDGISSSTADFRYGFTSPGFDYSEIWPGIMQGVSGTVNYEDGSSFAGAIVPAVTGTTFSIFVEGYIHTTGAGTVQLQWAQGTATVVDTKVYADSFLIAVRVG